MLPPVAALLVVEPDRRRDHLDGRGRGRRKRSHLDVRVRQRTTGSERPGAENGFSYNRAASAGDFTWTGKIVIPQYAARGTWTLAFVRLFDKAQNRSDYTAQEPVLSQVIFVVE